MSPRWRFWLMTGAAALTICMTLALGRWQLSRAAQKATWQAGIDAKSLLPALDGLALAARPDPAVELHRSATLRGSWLNDWTLFLDNRPMNGRAGLFAVTPFKLDDSPVVVLVQRGWVARDFVDRTRLPKVPTPAGRVEIQGRIALPPAKLYELAGSGTGLIRQNLNLERFRAESGLPLLTVSVQQLGTPGDGLLRDWPRIDTGVDKHYGYAFQWFGLGSLIAILYVWFQIVRRFIIPGKA